MGGVAKREVLKGGMPEDWFVEGGGPWTVPTWPTPNNFVVKAGS